MRLTSRLTRVAALLAGAGCGGATAGVDTSAGDRVGDGGTDGRVGDDSGMGADAGMMVPDAAAMPPTVTHDVPVELACMGLEETRSISDSLTDTSVCSQVCGSCYACLLPATFVAQVQALNPDGGGPAYDGGPFVLHCPTDPATVSVTCVPGCTGRLTAGYTARQRAARRAIPANGWRRWRTSRP
jgi:hypothetical protein